MTSLPHRLDRTVVIRAPRDLVFRFFTDTPRWASWWGSGSSIDARPGGRMLIRYPGGVEASGEVVEVSPPERIVFTYGYVSGKPAIPPGGSRVTIHLDPHHDGTRVRLTHELARRRASRRARAGLALSALALRERRHQRGPRPRRGARRSLVCGLERQGRRVTAVGARVDRAGGRPVQGSLQRHRRPRRASPANRRDAPLHARACASSAGTTSATVRATCSPTGRCSRAINKPARAPTSSCSTPTAASRPSSVSGVIVSNPGAAHGGTGERGNRGLGEEPSAANWPISVRDGSSQHPPVVRFPRDLRVLAPGFRAECSVT